MKMQTGMSKLRRMGRGLIGVAALLMLGTQAVRAQGKLQPGEKEAPDSLMYKMGQEKALSWNNHLHRSGKVVAYATPDSVHLSFVELACPLLPCATCAATWEHTRSFQVPGRKSGIIPAIRIWTVEETQGPDWIQRVLLGVLQDNGKVYEMSFSHYRLQASKDQMRWDSVNVHPAPGAARPTLLAPFMGQRSFLAAYAGGALRYGDRPGFSSQPQLPQQPPGDSLDNMGEDLTVFGGIWYGGAYGGIYQLSDTPGLDKRGALAGPIRAIQGTSAYFGTNSIASFTYDPFSVFWPYSGTWETVSVGGGPYLGFRRVDDEHGLRAALYPMSGANRLVRLADKPSRFLSIQWEGASLPPKRPEYLRYRIPAREDARFRIYDPEKNFGPLSITHIRQGQSEIVLDSMAQGGADVGCASLGYCVHPDSTNLDMILMRDTVTFTFYAEGFKPFGSGFCVSKYTERGRRTYKHSWKENDLLVIRIGEDTVKVLYDMAMAVRQGGPGRFAEHRVLDRYAGLSAWPAGVDAMAGKGGKAEFFGLDGARLGAYGLGESLAALPVGLVWVRWPGMGNGGAPAKLMLR